MTTPPAALTGRHRRNLRALGHALHPIVQIGRDGIDAGLIAALDRALLDHELVKVKLAESADLDRHDAADALAAKTKSEVAQVLGGTILLYRANPEHPQIDVVRGTRIEPAPKAAPPVTRKSAAKPVAKTAKSGVKSARRAKRPMR